MADEAPDVVLIMPDDQRPDTLHHMRAVQEHIRDKGTRFSRTVAATPTCCPSRASLLTGLHSRRTGVYGNTPPDGGWRTFFDNGHEDRTLATALQARGYRTGLVGKYLNGFAQNELGGKGGHRPPGWDVFLTFVKRTGAYYDYTLTDGTHFGTDAADYSTDVLGERAARFIRRTPSGQPLFLVFTPFAPHKPYRPAPRHLHDFADKLPYLPPAVGDRERGRQAAVPQGPPTRQAAGNRLRPDPAAGAAGVRGRRGGGSGRRAADLGTAAQHPAGLHVRQRTDGRRPPHDREGPALPLRDRRAARGQVGRPGRRGSDRPAARRDGRRHRHDRGGDGRGR